MRVCDLSTYLLFMVIVLLRVQSAGGARGNMLYLLNMSGALAIGLSYDMERRLNTASNGDEELEVAELDEEGALQGDQDLSRITS